MNLIIDRKFPYNFVQQLLQKFRVEAAVKVRLQDFTKIDVEMNELFDFPETTLSIEIISYALDKLVIIKRSNYYSIEFNPTINYPGTRIKLITLLQFISFGNSNVHGNSILTDEFRELNKNLTSLYEAYRLRGIVI